MTHSPKTPTRAEALAAWERIKEAINSEHAYRSANMALDDYGHVIEAALATDAPIVEGLDTALIRYDGPYHLTDKDIHALASAARLYAQGRTQAVPDWEIKPTGEVVINKLSAAPPVIGGAWLPIETAPKDGTHILVFNPDRHEPEVAWWSEHAPKYKWTTWDNGYLEGWAQYWQPLLAPPSSQTRGG